MYLRCAVLHRTERKILTERRFSKRMNKYLTHTPEIFECQTREKFFLGVVVIVFVVVVVVVLLFFWRLLVVSKNGKYIRTVVLTL